MRRFTRNHRLKPGPGTVRLNPDHFAGRPSAFWLMNEGGGNIHDLSGNGYTGTLNGGVTRGTDANGQTTRYDGTSGYFVTASSLNVSGGAVWVRVKCSRPWNTFGSNYPGLFGVGYAPSGFATKGIALFQAPVTSLDWHQGDIVFIGAGYTNTSYPRAIAAPPAIANGSVHEILAILSPTIAQIYFDGVPLPMRVSNPLGVPVNSNPIYVGQTGGGNYWDGNIDFIECGLSPPNSAQVWQLYQRPYEMLIPSGARRGFVGASAAPSFTPRFRRTRSELGTRIGSRQVAA